MKVLCVQGMCFLVHARNLLSADGSISVKAGMEATLMSEWGHVEIGSRSAVSSSEMLRMFCVGSALLRGL
jgi:hypothetical protein